MTAEASPEWPTQSARDVRTIALPTFGEVVPTKDPALPWLVRQLPSAQDEEVISDFLRELAANDCSPASCRSYGYDLLRWWRFLSAIERPWAQARREDVRDLVLWLRQAVNPQRKQGGQNAERMGAVNAVTGKRHLAAGYAPATINHALSVISAFYDHWGDRGEGPPINPVPRSTPGRRRYAHHNPLEEYRPHPRAAYRQRVPEPEPRAVADDLLDRVFASLGCHRDRALLAMYLSSGVRASELLGMTGADVDWGRQVIGVVTKGTRAHQWVPTSPDALTWLRLYLAEGFDVGPGEPLWWTVRQPRRRLQYSATRAVLQRVNQQLGANITLHDLRHTCALRLANDPDISLTDVQAVLRHARISTTARYLRPRIDDVIGRVQEHHTRPRPTPKPSTGWSYSDNDLNVLFGGPT